MMLSLLVISLLTVVCRAQAAQGTQEVDSQNTTENKNKKVYVAEVLGQKISDPEPRSLVTKILFRLRENVVKENNIRATEPEIDLYVPKYEQRRLAIIKQMESGMAKEQAKLTQPDANEDQKRGADFMIQVFKNHLHSDEYWIYLQALEHADNDDEKRKLIRQNVARMRDIVRYEILATKLNRIAYRKYGGRVAVLSESDIVPYEAQRAWLDEQQLSGECKIFDAEVDVLLKQVAASKHYSDATVSEEEGRELMTKALWWQEKPAGE